MRLVIRCKTFWALCAGALLLPVPALAQNYPNRPVRIVVGFTTGGAVDFTARVIGQKMTELYGHPVIIENRPGASTVMGTERVATAAPDGYTLLLIPTSTAIQSALNKDLSYDLKRDFAAISLLATGPFVVVVHPSLPVRNIKDLIAYARAQQGKLSVGSPGVGSAPHLAGALFNARSKISLAHVPYKGAGEAVIAAASGQAPVSFASVASVLPMLNTSRLRPLAVTSAKRMSLLGAVPTIDESGLPGYEYVAWYGLSAPAAVPKEIIAQLNATLTKIMQMPDIKEALAKQGMEPRTGTAEEFAAMIGREIDQAAKLLEIAGIKAE